MNTLAGSPRATLCALAVATALFLTQTAAAQAGGPNASAAAAVAVAPGDVIISEFRFRGETATDEFVELYNNTDAPITVSAADASAGWSLVASDGVARFTVPNGTVIPARGHFLGINSAGYTLASHPAGDGATATGDATYTLDIPDNDNPPSASGVALFATADPANFTTANRLDAAGFTLAANALYREGAGIGGFPSGPGQYSWVRKLNSGTPQDTGDNENDFLFIGTIGDFFYGGNSDFSILGAPGPENLSSPVQRNGKLKATYVDPACGGATGTALANPAPGGPNDGQPVSGCQNRARDTTPLPSQPNTSAAGTLYIRRRFTNGTGQPLTRLRFRVVDATAGPAPAGTADLRLLSSGDVTITTTSQQVVAVRGLTLEEPPAQAEGGGINSTVSAGTVTAATPLAAGASIVVQFRLGVQQTGTFRFFVNVEALTDAAPAQSATAAPAGRAASRPRGKR